MSLLSRFFTAHPKLTPEQARRLAAWQALPAAGLRQPFSQSRYVVADVETSGLNLARDHPIAIGAVAVQAGKINLADSLCGEFPCSMHNIQYLDFIRENSNERDIGEPVYNRFPCAGDAVAYAYPFGEIQELFKLLDDAALHGFSSCGPRLLVIIRKCVFEVGKRLACPDNPHISTRLYLKTVP